MRKITILFTTTPGQWLHKVFRTYITQPIPNFRYIDASGQTPTFTGARASTTIRGSILGWLFNLKRKIPWLIYHYKLWEEKRFTKQIDMQDADLIYCINGRFYHGKKPWVVDFENPSVFVSYNITALKKYKEPLKKILLRNNCKAVIAYSHVGKESIVKFFGKELAQKTVVIENAITLPKNTGKISHQGFNLLFTGSANIDDNFYGRGGKVVVQAFLMLCEKYPDMKLRMRCSVPEQERALLAGKNVEIYDGIMPAEEFEKMFRTSDVYVFPSYYAYALTLLDAMSYGLPMIISDHLDNKELVQNGVNGIKVAPPHINYVLPQVPDFYFNKNYAYSEDNQFTKRVAAAIETLYHDRALLATLAKGAKKSAKLYTVKQKNKKLKALFLQSIKQ